MNRMDFVYHKAIDIPSAPRNKSKANVESQTNELQCKDAETTPLELEFKSTQTDKVVVKASSAKNIRINSNLIQLLLSELAKCEEENVYFQELDSFHENQAIQLYELRKITIETLESSPISGLVCGQGRTVAVLCGERNHNTWCLHTGKVLVVDRQQRNWIHLGSCPTSATFAEQEQLIVGTASGEILLIFGGETLWSSSTIHLQTVTTLYWISSRLLFTASLDGRLTVLNLQGNSLELTKHSNISISELPKMMKRSNSSSLKVGVVSVTSEMNELFVATDTGAILSVDPETLESKALGYEIEGIEQFKTHNDIFFSINANREAKVLERNGQTVEWLGVSSVNSMVCRRDGLCVMLTEGELIGCRSNNILMRESSNLMAIDLDHSGNIVGVGIENGGIQIRWYEMSEYS